MAVVSQDQSMDWGVTHNVAWCSWNGNDNTEWTTLKNEVNSTWAVGSTTMSLGHIAQSRTTSWKVDTCTGLPKHKEHVEKWESEIGQHCLHCRIYLWLGTKHDTGQITRSGLPSDAGDVLPGRDVDGWLYQILHGTFWYREHKATSSITQKWDNRWRWDKPLGIGTTLHYGSGSGHLRHLQEPFL
jgi:hypothetical protein